MRRKHEYGHGGQMLAGNVRQRPVLLGFTALALPQVIEVGLRRKQVRGNQRDHLGVAATVIPQIKDEGIDVLEKVHRSNGSAAADLGIGKEVELQISNVAAQVFHLLKTA